MNVHHDYTRPLSAATGRPLPHSGQWLALAAGTLATAGALGNLLWEPYRAGTLGLEHANVPIVVAITIAAGHLMVSAGWRKPFAAAGFALAFCLGTYLTVTNSVGRQAEKADTAVLNAEADNAQRATVEAELKRGRPILAEELRAVAKECASGDGKACKGHKASVAVYEAAVSGWEGKLAKLPVRVVAPKAEKIAEVAALFGADKTKAKTAAQLVEPFALALLLELTAIVAFGYGFCRSGQPAWSGPASTDSAQTSFPAPQSPPSAPVPPKGSGRRGRKLDPKVIRFASAFRQTKGRDPGGADIQAAFPGIPRSTAYDYARRLSGNSKASEKSENSQTPAIRALALISRTAA